MDHELLKRRRLGRISASLAFAAMALTFGGCALMEMLKPAGDEGLAFNHRVHVEDEGLDCADCHATVEDADDPGIPVLPQCMLCHADLDEEKPPERQIGVLFDGNRYVGARAVAVEDDLLFSHLAHVEMGGVCEACHPGVGASERIDPESRIDMAGCMACHEKLNVANECSTCHAEIGLDWRPPSHEHQWLRFHGKAARVRSDSLTGRCDMCHTESSCVSCHTEEAPTSHTNYWRLRGHAGTAKLDRASCATCHRTDFCDRCHRETAPVTHAGSWGGTRSRHCLGCHFPLGRTSCATCHDSAPSHRQATPLPPGHDPAANCRQCHGPGLVAPLRHVDKGDDCTQCHM